MIRLKMLSKTNHWNAPKYRKSYKKKYGSKCFVDPIRLKYPICTNGKVNCKALNAAQYYSILNNKHSITKKIKVLKNKWC
jgi:hypothetical protein